MPAIRGLALKGLWAAMLLGLPAAANAQLYVTDPVYPSAPIDGSDPLVGLRLPGATPAEYRAHLLWNLRSGLNVAALSCQFSPFLRTVDNYNATISQHARELAAAYTALEGYFRRTAGRTGPRRFDDYSTQTYNNFSPQAAQFAFCQTAARIGREALAKPRGQLADLAAARVRELRTSLVPAFDGFLFQTQPIRLSPVTLGPPARVNCRDLPRSDRRACERAQREER